MNENFTSEQAADCARHNVCLGADMVDTKHAEPLGPYETLERGINSIQECEVPYHEMMGALEALNKKATEVDSYRYYSSTNPCWYCEHTCKSNADCTENGFRDFEGKIVVDVTKEAVEAMKQQKNKL